jgi:hypothetical protein
VKLCGRYHPDVPPFGDMLNPLYDVMTRISCLASPFLYCILFEVVVSVHSSCAEKRNEKYHN